MIPQAILRPLCNPRFDEAQFIGGKFWTGADKAKFANHFTRFLASDCLQTLFTGKFYERLIHTSGHIAHYNRHQFYEHFFSSRLGRIEFLKQTLEHRCFGDPAFTFSDVERALKARIQGSGLLDFQIVLVRQESERKERAEFARLSRKFQQPGAPPGDPCSELAKPVLLATPPALSQPPPPAAAPAQGDLFGTW